MFNLNEIMEAHLKFKRVYKITDVDFSKMWMLGLEVYSAVVGRGLSTGRLRVPSLVPVTATTKSSKNAETQMLQKSLIT